MCQQRADIMHSVKETARKILFPADSDEMNMGHITRHLKSVQERKVPDRNHLILEVREGVHRQRLARAAHNLQEHKR